MKFSAFVEVFLIFTALVVFNYIFDVKNLLYADSVLNIYLYAMTLISLFYGLIYGIAFYLLYFGSIYFYYHKVDIIAISHYFIFLTIFSEFMYYWNKKIKKLSEENDYLKRRIEELGSAYYLLKISHDELEKNYILKPYSIREMLREIRHLAYENTEESVKLFLQLLKKLFHIEKAGLFLKENENFILKDYIGEKIEFQASDLLVKNAIEYQTMTYIGALHDKKSEFLAVIPIVSLDNNFQGIFIIKEMPFFSLTKDHLITISLFLTYFINLLETIEDYKEFKNPFLVKEILSLQKLSKKFKAENYLIIFYIKNELEMFTIQKRLRGADISYPYKEKLIVILPFTPLSGVLKFCDKIKNETDVDYKLFNLSKEKFEEIRKYLNDAE